MKHIRLAQAALILSLLASATVEANDHGTYVGMALGQGTGEFDEAGIYTFSGPITDRDDKQIMASVYGGVDFDENFGLEVGYTDFGSYKATAAVDTYQFDVTGVTFDLVTKLPLNPELSLLAKLGVIGWTSDFTSCATGVGCLEGTTRDSDFHLGVGMSYQVSERATFRVMYEDYDIDTQKSGLGSIKAFSANAEYHF